MTLKRQRDWLGAIVIAIMGLGALGLMNVDATFRYLTGNINNVLTVSAPPYGCTSNTPVAGCSGIQQAIFDAEGATPPTFPNTIAKTVYVPPSTTNGQCFAINAPLRISSPNIEFKGNQGSCIAKNFAGPTIINEPWGQFNLTLGPCLNTGSLVGSNCSIDESATPSIVDLSQFLDTSRSNVANEIAPNGMDISFYVYAKAISGSTEFIGSHPSKPGSGNGWITIGYNGTPKPVATINTVGGLVTITGSACANFSATTVYYYAIDWDFQTYRLWGGTPGSTATLCGSTTSFNPPLQSPYEAMLLPDQGNFDNWMAGGLSNTGFDGYIDDILFRAQSLHTTAFTIPTTRNVYYDGWAWLLLDPSYQNTSNCTTALPCDGSLVGQTQYGAVVNNVYLPVLFSSAPTQSTAHIHDIEICPTGIGNTFFYGDGYFSQWGIGSEVDHITCSGAVYAGLNFYNNDFNNKEHNNTVLGGQLGILHGVAWNGSYGANDNMDDQFIACEETVGDGGGGMHDSNQFCVNRGTLNYCYMVMGEGFAAELDYPNCDQEADDSAYVATILNDSPNITVQINSPILTAVAGKPLIVQSGNSGPGPIVTALDLANNSASEIFDFVSTPTAPAIVLGSNYGINNTGPNQSNLTNPTWVTFPGIVGAP